MPLSRTHAVGLKDLPGVQVCVPEECLSACGAQLVDDVRAVAGPGECSVTRVIAGMEPDQASAARLRFGRCGARQSVMWPGRGERQERPDDAADLVAVYAPARGQGLHEVEATPALAFVFGLAKVRGGGAAFVEDGEDQEVGPCVESDAESAAG